MHYAESGRHLPLCLVLASERVWVHQEGRCPRPLNFDPWQYDKREPGRSEGYIIRAMAPALDHLWRPISVMFIPAKGKTEISPNRVTQSHQDFANRQSGQAWANTAKLAHRIHTERGRHWNEAGSVILQLFETDDYSSTPTSQCPLNVRPSSRYSIT